MRYRMKCPACGKVINMENGQCPTCHAGITLANGGYVQMYRLGSFVGVAAGFGIYVDGEAMGYIGNKETIRIWLPYGSHNLHVAAGMNRRCNDFVVNITPETPVVYAKVHMKMGMITNKFVLEVAPISEMPEVGDDVPPHLQDYVRAQLAGVAQTATVINKQGYAVQETKRNYIVENQGQLAQEMAAQQQMMQQQAAQISQPAPAPQPVAQPQHRNFFCMNCGMQMLVPVMPTKFQVQCPTCQTLLDVLPPGQSY